MLNSKLANRLELWGFEDGVMVFRDFSLGAAINLRPMDITCFADDAVNTVKGQVAQILNGVPSGLRLQFVQEIVRGSESTILAHGDAATTDQQELVGEITENRVSQFLALNESGSLPNQNLTLFIRRAFTRPPAKKGSGLLRRKVSVLKEDQLSREIHDFKRVVENLISALSQLPLFPTLLEDQAVFRMLYDQWNPSSPLPAPSTLSTPNAEPDTQESQIAATIDTQDIRDRVSLTDAVIGLDHFVLGRKFHKVISLKLLPEKTFSAMVQMLIRLPFDSKLCVTIEALDQSKEISSLQMQRRMAYASVVGKQGASDLEAQAKLQDIESLLEEMIQGVEKAFRFSLNVVLKSMTEDELDSQVAETLQKIREMNGAEGMLETIAAFDIFSEFAIPNANAKERAMKVNTSVLADLIPIYGNWRGHDNPSVLLRTRGGSLLTFDPFSPELTNSNMIVSGGSGTGKSFFANSLISQMLKLNPKVYILDIGASYRRICETLGGQYVELGIKSDMAINPFSLEGIERTDTEAIDQKIKFLVSIVEIMTKETGRDGLGRLEKSELEGHIKAVLRDDADPRLSSLMTRLIDDADPEMKRLGRILALWCGDSPYGKFVDRETTVRLDRDVVCFDLKGLENHADLQSVCLFLVTDLIWREVQRDRTRMKFTIFDECWKILADDTAANFIGEVYRTYRKYRASAIAISQTMDDFVKSKVAAAIMPNSSVRWILKQTGADQKGLKEALQLNNSEMALIANLESQKGQFSESFLMAESNRQVVRIESTALEYWLFTTNPPDLELLNQTATELPGLDAIGVLRVLADRFPNGAPAIRAKKVVA